ncbi:MAG: ABC transporter ATP-binding protein [Myxococcota bacterium]
MTPPTVLGQSAYTSPIRLWALFAPYRGKMVLGLLLLLLTNALQLTLPRLVNHAIALLGGTGDKHLFIFSAPMPPTRAIAAVLISICLLAIVAAAIRTWSRRVLFDVGRYIERDVRVRLFAHLSVLSGSFYRQHPVGDLLSRFTNDVDSIRLFAGFSLLSLLNLTIVFAATIPILFAIHPLVALCSLLPFPFVMVCARLLASRMFAHVKQQQHSMGQLTARVQENLSCVQTVRIFGQQQAEIDKFAQANHTAYKASLALALLRIFTFPFMRAMGSLGIAVTLYVGGRAVALGQMSLGDFVEINTRLMQLAWPAISLGLVVSSYYQARAALLRLNDVLITQPNIVDGHHPAKPSTRHAAVQLLPLQVQGLHLPATDGGEPLLQQISFTVAAGQTLAVVGKSGCGKSTLAKALRHAIDVPRGCVFYAGVDLLDWHLLSLSRQVAVVPQNPFLFGMSLRDNIAFGCPQASQQQIDQAVQAACLQSDIALLPQGLNTLVGEKGVMLSGGQRQRVALARALLLRPQLLILDDCFSAVDTDTQQHIAAALATQKWASSTLLFTHRLASVRSANEILVMDAGRICERGTHEQLKRSGNLYRALWGMQKLQDALQADATADMQSTTA